MMEAISTNTLCKKYSEKELSDLLQKLSPYKIDLKVKNNRSTYLSVRKTRGKVFHLCLHQMFLQAPIEIYQALIRYVIYQERSSLREVKKFVHNFFDQEKRETPLLDLKTQGAYYDLLSLYKEINTTYFSEKVKAQITWGEKPQYTRFRSITFGSYSRELRLIRINGWLDQPFFPDYFVCFIIYHEMLHDLCLPQVDSLGRRWVHTREFRERERDYVDFAKAKKWEKEFMKSFSKRKALFF